MAPSFKSEVEAYYEAKMTYNEHLCAALANREQPNEKPDSKRPLTRDGENLRYPTWDISSLPHLEGHGPSDYSVTARRVAEMREASEKGKSIVKKSQWAQIDKLLGR